MRLDKVIPDPEVLLSMPPSQLAGVIISKLNENQTTKVHLSQFNSDYYVKNYDGRFQSDIQLAMSEAWSFLASEGILVPEPGDPHGWMIVSRLGRTLESEQDYSSYLHAKLFPKDAFHPDITNNVYPLFLSGDYETAIFKAFKTVEVAVREACSPALDDKYGVELVRKAFNPDDGPLTFEHEPSAEREALMHLYAGALGRFKNPASHRKVPINDPREAIEMLAFASHLLRIVKLRAELRDLL